jgi:hypothetical protein
MPAITLPRQQPTYPNSRDVQQDGVWLQECLTCGKESGDCSHTVLEEVA